METILYLTHTQKDGTLSRIALETLTAACELSKNLGSAPIVVGLIGEKVQEAADSIAACGAAQILGVAGPDFSESRYGSDTAAGEALVKAANATLVIAPATSRLSRAVPGLAYRFKGRIDTHVSGIAASQGVLQIQRWYYRQRMLATLSRAERPWFMLVDAGVFQGWQGAKGSVALKAIDVKLPDHCKRTKVAGFETPSAGAQTIRPDADLLFVAGAGWTKKQSDGKTHVKDAEKLIFDFITKSKASLGSSKSLVDLSSEGGEVISYMSHLNQVGQTGSTPRHPKGLSTCCHGEEPHVVGWRFINDRRAVNLDPNCGWAQGKADVLYVADAFQVVEKLNELLSKS